MKEKVPKKNFGPLWTWAEREKPAPGDGKEREHAAACTHAETSTICVAVTAIPGSATTFRRPPTQAAKKVGIEPQLAPVPPR